MAQKRASSEPKPNPWWSDGARDEWRLMITRPADLPPVSPPMGSLPPVPRDDWDGEEMQGTLFDSGSNQLEGMVKADLGVKQGEKRDSRGKGHSDRMLGMGDFKTPPSRSKEDHGSDQEQFHVRREKSDGPRTEGLMPCTPEMEAQQVHGSEQAGQQSLEAALGEEITMQLWEENVRLRAALQRIEEEKKKGSISSWSEVSASQKAEVSTPRRARKKDEVRWTPNGTQVPLGAPPRDEEDGDAPRPPPIPPFPDLRDYERIQSGSGRAAKAQLGSESWLPREARLFDCWNKSNHRPDGARGLQAKMDLQLAVEEMNLRDAARLHDRALHLHHGIEGDSRASNWQHCGQGDNRALHPHHAVEGDSRAWHPCPLDHEGDRAQQWHDGRGGGSRACRSDRDCHGDPMGMRYQGRDLCHQQPHNSFGSDPRDEEGTSKVRERERSPHDAIRSNNPVLPRLPQYGTKTSSVDAADWIIEIQPIIGDMSNKATRWWTLTMQSTMKTYEKWLSATPLERLRLPPPDPVLPGIVGGDPMAVQRLEQRITTLLLPAIPDEIRQDLVANRELWPSAIMYKVLRTFQPGGWSERSSLLAELTQVAVAKDPLQAANGLRLWKRQRARALELGAGLPDLMLQVRALDNVVSKILPQHPQALFRVSAFRMETQIDERPTTESLLQFHELLQAEVDTMVHSAPGSGGAEKPSAKALQSSQISDKTAKDGTSSSTTVPTDRIKPCRFWGTSDGCKHAKSCKFGHAALPDSRERCWLCSSKEHRKSECPYGKDAAGPQAGVGNLARVMEPLHQQLKEKEKGRMDMVEKLNHQPMLMRISKKMLMVRMIQSWRLWETMVPARMEQIQAPVDQVTPIQVRHRRRSRS